MGERRGAQPGNGLQQERTLLAWRRTGLSLVVGSLVIARFAAVEDVWAAVGISMLAAVLALWAVLLGRRIGRGSAPSVREPTFDRMLYDGKLPAALAATVAALCVAEIMVVL